ncbi:hypothetical protein ACJQWK_06587 [Exserohilum turcicum]
MSALQIHNTAQQLTTQSRHRIHLHLPHPQHIPYTYTSTPTYPALSHIRTSTHPLHSIPQKCKNIKNIKKKTQSPYPPFSIPNSKPNSKPTPSLPNKNHYIHGMSINSKRQHVSEPETDA